MARPQEFDTAEALHQALDVFWRKGYEATSLADLLEAMDISKSSLYATFGGKRELFITAFDAYRDERTIEMYQILTKGLAREAINQFFRKIILDAGNGDSSRGCMSINQAVEMAPYDDEIRERVFDDFARIEKALTEAIKRGQSDGSLKNKNTANQLAQLLVMAFPGLQVMARAAGNTKKVEGQLKLLLSILD